MRQVLTTLAASVIAFTSTTVAVAGPGHFFGPPGPPGHPAHLHRAPWDAWIAPLVTGTVVGAVVASQPQTGVVASPVPVPSQLAGQTSGTVYKRVKIYIPECKCYRTYEVPMNWLEELQQHGEPEPAACSPVVQEGPFVVAQGPVLEERLIVPVLIHVAIGIENSRGLRNSNRKCSRPVAPSPRAEQY